MYAIQDMTLLYYYMSSVCSAVYGQEEKCLKATALRSLW